MCELCVAGSVAITAYGGGSGPVFHYNVQCGGNEHSLSDCVNGGVDLDRCSHSQDAGVGCLAGILFHNCMRGLHGLLSNELQVALREKSDLVEGLIWKVVWRSVSTTSGVLCVTRCGMTLMPEWSADNWEELLLVR